MNSLNQSSSVVSKFSPVVAWLAASLFFWLPINKAPFNIHFFLLLLCGLYVLIAKPLLSHNFKQVWAHSLRPALTHPMSIWLVGLFCLYALSLIYTIAPSQVAIDQLWRHRHLLYPLVLLPFLLDEVVRRRAVWFLFVSCVLILSLSFLVQFELIPLSVQRALNFSAFTDSQYRSGEVFQDYLRQTIQMSWLFGFCLIKMPQFRLMSWRWMALLVMAVLTAINMVWVLQGRTGYILLVVILLWYGYRYLGWRGLIGMCVLSAVGLGAAYFTSSAFKQRIDMTIAQAKNPAYEEPDGRISNPRTLMWETALSASMENPWFGYGVRGYPALIQTYPSLLDANAKTYTDPHNQFIFILVELGWVGLVFFMFGLARLIRSAWQHPQRDLMWLSLIIFGVAGLTNVHFNMAYPYQFFVGMLCLSFGSLGSFGSTMAKRQPD